MLQVSIIQSTYLPRYLDRYLPQCEQTTHPFSTGKILVFSVAKRVVGAVYPFLTDEFKVQRVPFMLVGRTYSLLRTKSEFSIDISDPIPSTHRRILHPHTVYRRPPTRTVNTIVMVKRPKLLEAFGPPRSVPKSKIPCERYLAILHRANLFPHSDALCTATLVPLVQPLRRRNPGPLLLTTAVRFTTVIDNETGMVMMLLSSFSRAALLPRAISASTT